MAHEVNMVRIVFRTTEENRERLDSMATRYGMSSNALVGFIVGQWLDNNYDVKDYMRDKMVEVFLEKVENEGISEIPQEVWADVIKQGMMLAYEMEKGKTSGS